MTNGFRGYFFRTPALALKGQVLSKWSVYNVLLDLERYDHTQLLVRNVTLYLYDKYGSFYADSHVNQNTSNGPTLPRTVMILILLG